MKTLNILIAEDGDFRDVPNSPTGVAYNAELRQPIMHADIVVQIKKNGETRLFKSRSTNGSLDGISGLVEEISFAYADGKI